MSYLLKITTIHILKQKSHLFISYLHLFDYYRNGIFLSYVNWAFASLCLSDLFVNINSFSVGIFAILSYLLEIFYIPKVLSLSP